MAKKARTGEPVQQSHTAETIWNLIASLPRAEKNKVFELVNGDPENEAVNELLQLLVEALRTFDNLWGSTEKLWGSAENASTKRRQLDEENAERLFGELRLKVGRLQPKKGMTQPSLETLALYDELVRKRGEQRGGKARALEELVTLPSEQGKKYVLDYNESRSNDPRGKGDMEAVRQHIKGIRTRGRDQQL